MDPERKIVIPEDFFDLFVQELRADDTEMSRDYYKFAGNAGAGKYMFRKSYFLSRLEYLYRHIGPKDAAIWDAGCGYGTTGIFLALNGYRVRGTTIGRQYGERLPTRLAFWSRHGEVSGFTMAYEDLLEHLPDAPRYDRIIVQDTLHHLEPIGDALHVLREALKPEGKIIAIEENGGNLIQRARLYARRRKRVVEYRDEVLGKNVCFGDENIRPFETWRNLFEAAGMGIDDHEYIRLFPPPFWSKNNYARRREQENRLYKNHHFLRDYLYFGVNFLARRA